MNSQLIKQTQEQGQTVITRSVQWVSDAINKSSICVFSTSIFRPQNHLAYACCMKPGCSEMIQSVSPHRASLATRPSKNRKGGSGTSAGVEVYTAHGMKAHFRLAFD